MALTTAVPAATAPIEEDEVSRKRGKKSASGFWTRHKTILNFWLDVVLLILFLAQAGMIAVLALVFPVEQRLWIIWGGTDTDWLQMLSFVLDRSLTPIPRIPAQSLFCNSHPRAAWNESADAPAIMPVFPEVISKPAC